MAEQPAKQRPKADAALLKELEMAADECREKPGGTRYVCSGPNKQALNRTFIQNERSRIDSLSTLVQTLSSETPKLRAISAAVLYETFRTTLGPEVKAGDVSGEQAQGLLDVAVSLPAPLAVQVIPAATHAAWLAGQGAELQKALQGVPTQVSSMSLRYSMVYGRLEAFKLIKTDTTADTTSQLAAVESPRNMRAWSTSEQDTICPWVLTFLESKIKPVSDNALAALSNCTGAELDQLLDATDKALTGDSFSFIHATALRDACGPARSQRERGASDEQCERVRQQLTRATKSSRVEDRVRSMSLSALSYSWPDDKTLALAEQLSKGTQPAVSLMGKQTAARLGRNLAASAPVSQEPK